MSKGVKINLSKAKEISAEWINKLSPFCLKISNAGTVRREDKEYTQDIDIVLIRDESQYDEFEKIIESLERVSGDPHGKSCRRKLENGVCLDIRMCLESNWGWILLKHTGPTSFYIFADEEIDDDIGRDFESEQEIFEELGMEYIEPKYRNILDSGTIEKLRGQYFIGNTPQQTKLEILQENKMNWLNKMKHKKQIGMVDFKPAIQNAKERIGHLSIRGFIGETFFEEGVTDQSVAKALKEIGTVDILKVLINSGGGSIFDAFSIFTQLRKFNAKIIIQIEGLAASAAAFISQAGDEREMSGNALFMAHKSSGGAFGNDDIVEKLLNLLRKIDSILINTFKKTSKLNITDIKQLMKDETFFTAEEAMEKGFVDKITDDSDEEPHVKPDDKIENTVELIYKHHAKVFADDEKGLKALSDLVENEIQPDKFSTLPYAPSGDFDNPSLFNLPFINDNGVVNINGLRYFNARLSLMPLRGTQEEIQNNRTALANEIVRLEKDFATDKASGKYQDDKIPSSVLLEVVVAGKPQVFFQTMKEIQMNALIMNKLGVKDETELLAEITRLQAFELTSNVVSPFTLNVTEKTPEALKIMADTAATIKPAPDALASIQNQLTQILNQNSTLMAENQRLSAVKDVAISKVEEVIQFKNEEILRRRHKTLNALFHEKHKINPVQLAKAIKDFVDIEPSNVPTTEDLYQLSLQVYETNEVIDGMETTNGLNPDGNPVLTESAVDKFDAEVNKVIKENSWNAENAEDLNKAVDIVTEKNPKLAQAYAEESAPVHN